MTGGFFMLLLHADKISKFYGDRKIFSDVTLKLYSGDRVGVVGPNGAGKTTLLNILSGADKPDDGHVRHYTTISYVRQQDDGVPEIVSGSPLDAADAKIAGFLKVNVESFHKGMSGGEKARARFALSYDSQCGLLIVDEPTSNMDMEASRVIEEELLGFDGALLIVSHDRELLDMLCTSVLEVSDGTVTSYNGNYSDYVRQREAAYERQQFEYEAYIKEKTRLQNRIQERVENMKSVKKAPSRMGNSEARLHKREATAVQKKLNQGIDILESRLAMMEKKERPKDLPQVMMRIDPPTNPVSARVARTRDLSMGFEGKPLVDGASFEILTGKRTALLGKNGSGKTTLAEMIYRRDNQITIAPGVEIGYFKQDFSLLDENRTILENVRAESTKPEHEIRASWHVCLLLGMMSLKGCRY
jgi:macrolide transport system ATP-binding/permease protein